MHEVIELWLRYAQETVNSVDAKQGDVSVTPGDCNRPLGLECTAKECIGFVLRPLVMKDLTWRVNAVGQSNVWYINAWWLLKDTNPTHERKQPGHFEG
jgi:hypothetical protein